MGRSHRLHNLLNMMNTAKTLIIGSILIELGLVSYLLFPKDDPNTERHNASHAAEQDQSVLDRILNGPLPRDQDVRDRAPQDDALAATDSPTNNALPENGNAKGVSSDGHAQPQSAQPPADINAEVSSAPAMTPVGSGSEDTQVAAGSVVPATPPATATNEVAKAPAAAPRPAPAPAVALAPPPAPALALAPAPAPALAPARPVQSVAPGPNPPATTASETPRPAAPSTRHSAHTLRSAIAQESSGYKARPAPRIERWGDSPPSPAGSNEVAAAMTDELVRESAVVKATPQPPKKSGTQ
jgi:hypothetical protein